jgi:hypothetical protein
MRTFDLRKGRLTSGIDWYIGRAAHIELLNNHSIIQTIIYKFISCLN